MDDEELEEELIEDEGFMCINLDDEVKTEARANPLFPFSKRKEQKEYLKKNFEGFYEETLESFDDDDFTVETTYRIFLFDPAKLFGDDNEDRVDTDE